MSPLLSLVLCSICFVGFVAPVAIDNGVVGAPEIGCGSDSITLSFTTKNEFQGKIFVKDHADDPLCVSTITGGTSAALEIKFSDCGVKRERSANPRGVFVGTSAIISFHTKLVTKIDKIYKFQCFYMEADKTVTTELEVSVLTPEVELLTETVPMPVCVYEILNEGPQGEVVKYTVVGQQVYHHWLCSTETTNMYCMSVYSCFVEDGKGEKIDLVNEEGCAIDGNLLNNIDYSGDLEGGVEAHVFKFADRPNLYFNCQIRITLKEANTDQCPRTDCPAPVLLKKRKKRALKSSALDDEAAAVIDVSPQDVEVLELDYDEPPRLGMQRDPFAYLPQRTHGARQIDEAKGICISPTAFGLVFTSGAAILAVIFAVAIYVVFTRGKSAKTFAVSSMS